MKLAQFRYMDEDRIGVALGDSLIVDVHEAAIGLKLPFNFPYTMRELIDFDTVAQETVRFLLYQSERYPHRVKPIPLTDIEWLPPIRRPGKILCVTGDSLNRLSYLLKSSSSMVGHSQPIELCSAYDLVYSYPNLAVVMGKRARSVPAEHALEYVYGYTVFNNIVGQPSSNPLLHGADSFGPMGPWLVTKNEVPEPNTLEIIYKLGQQAVAQFKISSLSFKIEDVISAVSIYQTLEPGDVICLGAAAEQAPTDLQSVDSPVQIEISGIGCLVNPIQHH